MYNSIYPVQIKPYVPPQNQKQVDGKEENESSQSSDMYKSRRSGGTDPYGATDPNGRSSYPRHEYPNGQKSTIDYSKSKVNIAQIITDFKSTANAIGAPPTIIQEVDQYLALAENQSLKNDPDKKLIQSNLKNASNVLDKFISQTLNKKSKVVENWIEALFLQQVDYKSDPSTVNEDFLVKLPDKETGDMKPISQNLAAQAAQETPQIENTQIQQEEIEQPRETQQEIEQQPAEQPKRSNVYIPQDAQVRKSFLQGKKYVSINQTSKAIEAFNAALTQAQYIGDTNAEGMASFELGKIYDNQDNLDKALGLYNQAYRASNDNNLKAQALYAMAEIYNDVVYFEPAMDHYFAAISYAGEAENLNAQTKALSDIADMYAERYDVAQTYKFYGAAKNIALETNNPKIMGAIWSRSGDSMSILNENVNALQDYKSSARFYEQAESPVKMAKNYEKASIVMRKLGNRKKAQSLLEKAHMLAVRAADADYAQKIEKQLNVI